MSLIIIKTRVMGLWANNNVTGLRPKVINIWFGELLPSYVCNVGGLNFGGYGTESYLSG